jgi:riboflavin kinase/FMN adenylyltransferase
VVVHFDQLLRETTYDAFVAMIADRAPIAGFLMTPDAAFGYRRGGTPEGLAALGAELGFDVVVVPPFELDGRPVRSSEVRTAIAAGDVALAAHLLGRAHCVVGQAVNPVSGPGTLLRFPLPVALPPNGTYPVEVGPVHAGSPDEAVIESGSMRLFGTEPAPWVRVAFSDTA